jgi:hypothetical protein
MNNKFSPENLKKEDLLEDTGLNGNIILKYVLREKK